MLKDFLGLPITVKEANVTYDAAINGNNIYTTSWAGGYRYNTTTKIWQRVPLPEDSDLLLNTCDESSYTTTTSGSVLRDFYLNPRDPEDGAITITRHFPLLASLIPFGWALQMESIEV